MNGHLGGTEAGSETRAALGWEEEERGFNLSVNANVFHARSWQPDSAEKPPNAKGDKDRSQPTERHSLQRWERESEIDPGWLRFEQQMLRKQPVGGLQSRCLQGKRHSSNCPTRPIQGPVEHQERNPVERILDFYLLAAVNTAISFGSSDGSNYGTREYKNGRNIDSLSSPPNIIGSPCVLNSSNRVSWFRIEVEWSE
ncbi:hypothetical protein C8R44DRAFT_732001 [Mycena epipterygia]|nr:hypothetical protein C8R44DRAFT_732001 [Mycena epipterygia]